MIVYIAPVVAVQDVVGADTAAVDGVGSQAAAVERKCLLRYPFGPVLAVVEYVVGDVSRCAGIVFPRDVVQIVECAVFYRLGIGVGPAVSNSVVVECFGRIVLAAGQFVPWVIGDAVAIGVVAHHHYARLGAAAAVFGVGGFIEAVAPDAEVVAGKVDHGVVKGKGHVTAVGAERNHHIVGAADALAGLACHVLGCIALIVARHLVDKLSRGGAILGHGGYVGTEFDFFVKYVYGHRMAHGHGGVFDVETQRVASFFGGEEYQTSLSFDDAVGAVGARDGPAVVLSGECRVKVELGHACHAVVIVQPEADDGRVAAVTAADNDGHRCCQNE